MSQQKAFKKSNPPSTIWTYSENKEKEIVCSRKSTNHTKNKSISAHKYSFLSTDNQVTRNRCAIAGNGRAVSPRVSADASRQRLTRDWCHSPCSTKVHRGNSTNRAPVGSNAKRQIYYLLIK